MSEATPVKAELIWRLRKSKQQVEQKRCCKIFSSPGPRVLDACNSLSLTESCIQKRGHFHSVFVLNR